MSELKSLLRRGLEELSGCAPPEQVSALGAYTSLLERWAARINLTGHRDAEDIARRLVLDAVALWLALPSRAEARSVADLGSGAGLPGFPIAILAPKTRVELVESRLRRHHFQRAARRELGLANVRLRHGRIEELDPHPADLVIAQAVAPPPAVLGWLRRWAAPGGWLAIPGVLAAEAPLSAGGPQAQGLEDVAVVQYRVPVDGRARTVWVARTPS